MTTHDQPPQFDHLRPNGTGASLVEQNRELGRSGLAGLDQAARMRMHGHGVAAGRAVRWAIAAFRESGQSARETAAWLHFGEILLWEGRFDAAAFALREAREVDVVEEGTTFDLQAALFNGDLARAQGHAEEARASYRRVLRVARVAGYRAMAALASAKLGALFHLQQRPDRAARVLAEAAEELDAMADSRAAAVWNNQAVNAVALHDWEHAARVLERLQLDLGGHPARNAAAEAARANARMLAERRPLHAGWAWCRISQFGPFVTAAPTVMQLGR